MDLSWQPEDKKQTENGQCNKKQNKIFPRPGTIALFLKMGDCAAMRALGNIFRYLFTAVETVYFAQLVIPLFLSNHGAQVAPYGRHI
ncbi:hypothetical protein [endosymbiont of Lamellibrachia barhami]|uniref:hypothetical protein n=1 Tax=endosymbiont of Lamellibrachia barhami TaxID=205975 RepID=UPI0015AC008F|nr:hypothetical protein [endosymbiont of Lamellibrachia barhami]